MKTLFGFLLGLMLLGMLGCTEPKCLDCGDMYSTTIGLDTYEASFLPGDTLTVMGWAKVTTGSGANAPGRPVDITFTEPVGGIEFPFPPGNNVTDDSGLVRFRYRAHITQNCLLQQFYASGGWGLGETCSLVVRAAEIALLFYDSVTVTIVPDTLYLLPPENSFLPRVEVRLFVQGEPVRQSIDCIGFRFRLRPSYGELPWQNYPFTDTTGLSFVHWQLPRAPGLYTLTYSVTGDTAARAVILPGHRP